MANYYIYLVCEFTSGFFSTITKKKVGKKSLNALLTMKMDNTDHFCNTEMQFPQGTLCCAHQVLSNVHNMPNSSLMYLLQATRRCFPGDVISNTSIHQEHLTNVFFYVMECGHRTTIPSCSSAADPRCSKQVQTQYGIYMAFLVVVMLVAFLGNALLILIICNTRELRKMSKSFFIGSLAVSDLLVSLLIIPIKLRTAYHNLYFCDTILLCRAYITIDNILFVASITNLFMLTIDRFVALQHTFSYVHIMSKRRVKYAAVLIWIYAICWGAASNVNWSGDHDHASIVITGELQCSSNNKIYILSVFSFVFYLPTLIMGYIYTKIFQISRKHIKAISAVSIPSSPSPINKANQKETSAKSLENPFAVPPSPTTSPLNVVVYVKKDETIIVSKPLKESPRNGTKASVVSKDHEEWLKMFKVAKTVGVVYGCFMSCWLPISIFATGIAWSPTAFSSTHAWPHVLVAEVLPVLNSTMNPVIYSLKNKVYVKAFGVMVNKARQRMIGYVRCWTQIN